MQMFSEKSTNYEYVQVAVPASQTDWSVKANTSLFTKAPYGYVRIVTNQGIGVRYNAVANAAVQYTSSESPIIVDTLAVSDILITTWGSITTVGIFITRI